MNAGEKIKYKNKLNKTSSIDIKKYFQGSVKFNIISNRWIFSKFVPFQFAQ